MNKGIILQSLENQKIIGSTYEYYVKGLDGDREFTSDTKSATITTGVKKYRYYLTSDNDEIPDKKGNIWTEVNSVGELEKIKLNSFGRYLHIYSIDGAGNESDITKIELVKQRQNVDLTKEIINPKNEYKIGDIVTYSIKFKIRENENNRASISEVNVNDVYPEEYLEYLPDTLVKKGQDISLTKEEGALRIFTHLNYGDTKEVKYSMKIKDNANGKELKNVVSTTELLDDAVGSTAKKTIKVNDPKIDIQKSVDKLEYKVR